MAIEANDKKYLLEKIDELRDAVQKDDVLGAHDITIKIGSNLRTQDGGDELPPTPPTA